MRVVCGGNGHSKGGVSGKAMLLVDVISGGAELAIGESDIAVSLITEA